MARRKSSLGYATAMIAAAGVLACRQRAYVPPGNDAAADGAAADGLAPLALDISVTGCAVFDLTAITCDGWAPLTLSFSPVGSPALTSFLWTFGDGSPPSTERAPSHSYALPGSYDVAVTGANPSVGSISQQRRGFVVVQPQPVGEPCDVDAQCADGLGCACKPGSGCAPAFARGVCSTACATGFCGAGAVCAAYAFAPPAADGGANVGGGSSSCLAACETPADCPAGFVCESFRAGGAASPSWVRGCLPLGAATDVGGSCRNPAGQLDGSLCSTGHCVDTGALGVCSAACAPGAGACPSGFACARLGAGESVCLGACAAGQPCSSDPGLTCAVPASVQPSPDASGFQIIGSADAGTYCGPR